MKTTIDAAGRVIVPKALRDKLGLVAGQELEASARDGVIELEIAPARMRMERRDGVLVAIPESPLPPLTDEQVRDALEHVRR